MVSLFSCPSLLFSTMRHVSLEGIPSIGKSFLMDVMKSNPYLSEYIDFRPEPLDEWTNPLGNGPLDKFYADPKSPSNFFVLQRSVLNSLRKRDWKPAEKPIILSERAMGHSAFNVFLHHGKEILSQSARQELVKDYRHITAGHPVDLFIYLRAGSIDLVMNQLKARGRKCEANISREYMLKCHELHDQWMLGSHQNLLYNELFPNCFVEVPVVVVDMEKVPDMQSLADTIGKIIDGFAHHFEGYMKSSPREDYISPSKTIIPSSFIF